MSDLSRVGVLDPTGRCPKCGCSLLTNDYGQRWCTDVGGGGLVYTGCNYGMSHDKDCASRDHQNMPYMPHTCDCGYEEAHRDKIFVG